MAQPDHEAQERFWTGFLLGHPGGAAAEEFTARIVETARECALRVRPQRVLEVGCGTGSVCAALSEHAEVTGNDLSSAAIEQARARHPQCRFVAGDFLSLQFDGEFDLITSTDVIAHVGDQRGFIRKCRKLLRPSGTLLVMTQNAFVWSRTSSLAPKAAGQIRDWPSLGRLRSMLAEAGFAIRRLSSVVPGGNQGLLFWRRYVQGAGRLLLGKRRADGLLERALLGREIIVEAALPGRP